MNGGGIELFRDNIENFLILKTELPDKELLLNLVKRPPIRYHLCDLLMAEGLGLYLKGFKRVHLFVHEAGVLGLAI